MKLAPEESRARLLALVATLPPPFEELCRRVITDERFLASPGACAKHHAWPGGLAQHTLEVLEGVAARAAGDDRIIAAIAFTAAVWHDFGKIFDIGPEIPQDASKALRFEKTPHYGLVYHISRSYHEWMVASAGLLPEEDILAVAHCIVSHHGRPEWGSYITPKTFEAEALHAADMDSAHGRSGVA